MSSVLEFSRLLACVRGLYYRDKYRDQNCYIYTYDNYGVSACIPRHI